MLACHGKTGENNEHLTKYFLPFPSLGCVILWDPAVDSVGLHIVHIKKQRQGQLARLLLSNCCGHVSLSSCFGGNHYY